ncbi:MAG: DUF1080 domain-containing protein [Verrucomicrobiota bacterium]
MKCFAAAALILSAWTSAIAAEPTVSLFDGRTFAGWQGDTNKTWRIEQGAFVGGSLQVKVPQNEFLTTRRSFTNFLLRVKVKLVGSDGFVNGGVQIRSERIANPPNEMRGYQCDMGEGYWGALYDESRRNKMLAQPDAGAVLRALKKTDWNQYEIRGEGKRIRLWLNGVAMIDYTESDDSIPQFGLIGLQIHGGAKAESSFKDIEIEELP